MRNETSNVTIETSVNALHQAALHLDGVPTIGMVVATIVLHVVTSNDQVRHVSPWVKGSGLVLLMAYFAHQYVAIEPYGAGEFMTIGLRCISLLGIYLPIAKLIDSILSAFKAWRSSKFCIFSAWWADTRDRRSEQRKDLQSEKRRREVEANAPVPLSDAEAFEYAMQKSQNDFAQQCHVINSNNHLDEFEVECAISQARAKMTTRINNIMEGKY